MIILNEKEYAEQCLSSGHIDSKPYKTLTLLAKYYYHCLGYRKAKITKLLIEYMENNYPRYKPSKLQWNDTIEKIAAKAAKYPLYENDGIWITESELNAIDSLSKIQLKRLAFTLLCIAKLGDIRNENNDGWVNTDDKTIFELARVTCKVGERFDYFGDLNILGLLEFPKKNGNLSNRVSFIDNDSNDVLFISDFRELGYEYMNYIGDGNFIRCANCGILTKTSKTGRTRKYCKDCAADTIYESDYVPQETKTINCIDCGKPIEVSAKDNQTNRCPECYDEYRREYSKIHKRKQRED